MFTFCFPPNPLGRSRKQGEATISQTIAFAGLPGPPVQQEKLLSGASSSARMPFAIPLAILFAFGLITAVFAFRPLVEWDDLFRYVQRFSIDPYYGMEVPQKLIDYPLSEYGWQLIVLAIFESGFAFEASFAVISMAALGLMAYVLLRETGRPLALLVFVNPAMIDFIISQVRSSLALGIVIATIGRSLPVALGGIALASTIHTSMLLFAVPLLINALKVRIAGVSVPTGVSDSGSTWAILALIAAVMLAGSQILILDFLGDRRADYALVDISTGTLLTIAWSMIGLAGFALAQRRSNLAMIAAMFLLGMFVTSSLLGLYSHRYAAFLVPFLALAVGAAGTPRMRLVIFAGLYGAFSLLYFAYWL